MGDIFGDFRRLVLAELNNLAEAGALPSGLDFARIAVEPPRDPSHGDLSTNAAMVLAGQAKRNPLELAEKIGAALHRQIGWLVVVYGPGSTFTVEVAKPGFLNIRLSPEILHAQLSVILRAGTGYGDSKTGAGERVNVEFVSANPTGPM